MSNEISLPELMPPEENGAPILRKRRPYFPVRMRILLAVFAICVAIGAAFIVSPWRATQKPQKTEPPSPVTSGGAVTTEESTPVASSGEAEDSLPVVLPIESDTARTDTEAEKKETEPTPDSAVSDVILPSGAIPIKEVTYPCDRADIVNYTAHSFDLDVLEVMSSAVIPQSGNGPTVLIISAHTSECYLPAGALYYSPDEHLTHTSDKEANVTAVAAALYRSLSECGINALHITVPCDGDGSSRAYINARNAISEALALHPSIKYVLDVERAIDTDADGKLLRSAVALGKTSYAPIRLTVSGGGSLSYQRICQNLAFALRLNGLLSEQSPSLTRPVQIADAVYTDGSTPRTLKIEVGSYTSTLDEAVSSAYLLGELIALLLS